MATIFKRPKTEFTGDKVSLIDYDIIVYSAGHASDNSFYVCDDGSDFKYKAEAVAHTATLDLDPSTIQSAKEPEPIENCLFTVKRMIHNIVSRSGGNKDYRGYLTGKDNYREIAATIQPYKGQRAPNKPHWYDSIRDYIVDNHNGTVVDGMEADDALGIAQYANYLSLDRRNTDTIICTRDKDLKMIPGWHYDWTTKDKPDNTFYVNDDQAIRWFYTQMLTGDATDNIVGCGCKTLKVYQSGAKKGMEYMAREGVGAAEAKMIIDDCKDELEMYKEVREAYIDYYLTDEELLENATLLWILREPGVFWTPPLVGDNV